MRRRNETCTTQGPLASAHSTFASPLFSSKLSKLVRGGSLTILPPNRNRPCDSSPYHQRDALELCGPMPESEGPGVFVATCLQQPLPPNIKRSILLRSIVLLLLLLRGGLGPCLVLWDGARRQEKCAAARAGRGEQKLLVSFVTSPLTCFPFSSPPPTHSASSRRASIAAGRTTHSSRILSSTVQASCLF